MIVHLPPKAAGAFRPAILPLLAKVARRTNGRYEAEDIFAEVLSGQQTLWVAWDEKRNTIDAAMTTQLVDYPRARAVRVLYVAGSRMREWFAEFVEQVEAHARQWRATIVEGAGRPGWERMWPGMGNEGIAVMYKELK